MKPPAPVTPAPVTPAPEQISVAPVTVPVSASEPAERLPKIVYPGNDWSHTPPTNQTQPLTNNSEITLPEVQVKEVPIMKAPELPVTETPVTETPVTETQEQPKATATEKQEPPKVTLEVNAHELEEIRAILAERQKDYQLSS